MILLCFGCDFAVIWLRKRVPESQPNHSKITAKSQPNHSQIIEARGPGRILAPGCDLAVILLCFGCDFAVIWLRKHSSRITDKITAKSQPNHSQIIEARGPGRILAPGCDLAVILLCFGCDCAVIWL